jgi:hypothetical protein
MPYAREKLISRKVPLVAGQPVITVEMTVQVALPGPQYHSLAMGVAPIIPYTLLDTLWSQGLCQGVHAAYQAGRFSLTTSCIKVDFLDLSLPPNLEHLNDEQLEVLRSTLESMVHDSVGELLAEMSEQDELNMPLEEAEESIRLHGGRLPEHARADSSLQHWLLQSMLGPMAPPAIPDLPELAVALERAFREVMEGLAALQAEYQAQSEINKEVVSALWWISRSGRWLAQENEGAREGAAREPFRRCRLWIDTIAHTVQHIVDGTPIDPRVLLKIALEPDYEGVITFL